MSTTSLPAPTRVAIVARVTTAPFVLATMVVVSAIAQFIAASPRASVRYLPDEYLYSQLARSLGNGDGSTVLGQAAALPAMLEPLLTAGFWASPNAETSIHLTQAFHSIAMALAAIPVYLIARQLRLSTTAALVSALVGLVAPGMLYASYVTADALGYLLALVAVHAAVRVFSRPTAASQCWFLAAAGLATFARLQYATLIPAFIVGALVVERFRPVRAARRFPVIAGAVGLAAIVALVAGASLLGRYGAITDFGISLRTAEWTVKTGAFLLVVTGAAIAPAALAWGLSRILHPSDRARAGFAALSLFLLGSIVVAAAMVSADTFSDRFLERYLLIAFPLVAIAFFCWIDENRPARVLVIIGSAAVVIAAARTPVSGDLVGQGSADSPTLLALSRLGGIIGLAEASLVAALVVTVCALLGLGAALSRRIPATVLVVPTVILLGLVAAGAHAADIRASKRAHASTFSGEAAWIEAAKPGPTTFVQTPGSNPYLAMVTTVWNPSIVRAEPLGTKDIIRLDGLGTSPLSLGRDGVLRERDGTTLSGSALFATGGSAAIFTAGDRVTNDRFFSLVIPSGDAVRLRAFAAGVRSNNTIAREGSITAYPTASGGCTKATLSMTLPAALPPSVLGFRDASGAVTSVRIRSGKLTKVAVTSTSSGARTLTFTATKIGNLAKGSSGGLEIANGQIVANVATGRITSSDVACGSTS
jgi:Dolichyl-phosphate-mannose-protein mannosyltransferase